MPTSRAKGLIPESSFLFCIHKKTKQALNQQQYFREVPTSFITCPVNHMKLEDRQLESHDFPYPHKSWQVYLSQYNPCALA